MAVRALRGATTVTRDDADEILAETEALVAELYERNGLTHDDVISVLFTATTDLRAVAPAAAARRFGLTEVPLLCAQEMEVEGSLRRCIRALLHVDTSRPRAELRHVYLNGAVALRPDLAEPS